MRSLQRLYWLDKHPTEKKLEEYETKDERNMLIRYKSKAVCEDILRTGLIAGSAICVAADGPKWLPLTLTACFVLISFLEWGLRVAFNKRM